MRSPADQPSAQTVGELFTWTENEQTKGAFTKLEKGEFYA